MKVVVSGASGLIGSALVRALRADGHQVVTLVRRAAAAATEVSWDPAAGRLDARDLEGVDGAVHLAGAGVGDHRWTDAYKKTIRDSRVDGTRTLAAALASLERRPEVLVSGSAIGYYGDTGDRAVDETAPAGSDFLAGVCVEWEAAAAPAEVAGIRVAHIRTGLVFARDGGALKKQIPLFKLGVGGKLGSGRQYWSFISLEDEIRAITFLLRNSGISGPVNLTAPNPVTNADATAALGKALHRPSKLPVPKFALKAVLGEFSDDILGSQRVLPRVLTDAGFEFRHPDVTSAVRTVV